MSNTSRFQFSFKKTSYLYYLEFGLRSTVTVFSAHQGAHLCTNVSKLLTKYVSKNWSAHDELNTTTANQNRISKYLILIAILYIKKILSRNLTIQEHIIVKLLLKINPTSELQR